MQARLGEHSAGGNRSAVRYSFHYKANDIKPLAAELYPHLAAGHEWWAWADLDVVFEPACDSACTFSGQL